MISSKIEDSEAVLNLTNLFYEKNVDNSVSITSEIVQRRQNMIISNYLPISKPFCRNAHI